MKKITLILLGLFTGSLLPTFSHADNPGDFLRSRTYIGLEGTSVSVGDGGVFSGKNFSRGNAPYEIDLIPTLSQNFGFGVLLGHREEVWAAELSFWQSNHNASFGPGVVQSAWGAVTFTQAYQDQATYNSINLDFKRYFLSELQIQPFLNLGVSFPWVVIQNGSGDSNGNFSSLTLAGLGLNAGLGAEYYISPLLSVTAGANYRFASFDQAKGIGGAFYNLAQNINNSSDEGSGFTFMVGTSVGFQ